MTIKGFMKKLTGKLTLLLALVALLSFSMFFFSACGENNATTTEKEYTRSTENTTPISNMNFDYGTESLDLTKYPYATSSWNRSLDNNAKTSQVNSGIIDISEKGWDQLIRTLYDDSDFLYFANSKYAGGYPETNTTKKAAIDEYNNNPDNANKKIEYTDDTLKDAFKEFVVRTFDGLGISKPKSHDGMNDTKVFMLNNYMSKSSEELGFGTAQVITSASSVTLEKGKYAEISVWVMTQNISGQNKDGKIGANIRLTNSIKGVSQAQYRVSNIDTNGEWEKYTIYVKADDTYDTTFTLVLGLGYGSGATANGLLYTEGTAYFDDISYNVLTKDEFDTAVGSKTRNTRYLNYGENEPLEVDARALSNDEVLIYKLEMSQSLNDVLVNLAENDLTVTEYFTEAEGKFYPAITSKTMFGERSSAEEKEGVSVELNNAAYTFEINNDKFTLENGKYAFITFDVLNNLSKFGSSNIAISIIDEYGDIVAKRESVATVSEISENVKKVGLIIKNNFAEGNARTFKIMVEIGPKDCDILTTTDITKYATGTVTLSNFKIANGTIDDEDDKLFSFFTSIADNTQALYAGFTTDYTKESQTKSYDLSPASGNIGEIISYPTNLQNYKGIVAENHNFVNENGTDLSVNTRSGKGNDKGNAGLINTEYLGTYNANVGLNIANFIGEYEEDFQPLMIYNKEADHYGFIGTNNTVPASSYAKVSVTLRVVDDAKAYIYLINTYGKNKDVMLFDDFTSNGNLIKGEDLNFALTVDKDMMENDGWVTVDFYVATGKTEKQFRLEIWNGGRDNAQDTASAGYVFVKNISIATTGAFTEATRFADTFNNTTTPLGIAKKEAFSDGELYLYKFGEKFNEQSYVWAKNDTMVYGIFNTIDMVEESQPEEQPAEEVVGSGCNSNADPATFWLSFSSILLAVVLVVAIIALFIKNLRRGRKGRKSDAKSHYAINSRAKVLKTLKEKKEKDAAEEQEISAEENSEDGAVENVEEETEETNEEVNEENSEEASKENKESLDEYVYGEVTDFGETETNEDANATTEETPKEEAPIVESETNSENKDGE